MTEDRFDLLLKRMSDIASAVNAFSCEQVQADAFEALIVAFNGGQPFAFAPRGEPAQPEAHSNPSSSGINSEQKKGNRKRRERVSISKSDFVKDLDLRPEGKQAFAEFVDAKRPSSNEDKYAVAVYYLEQILDIAPITDAHVATVFKMTPGWREPQNVRAGLRVTANRKATIDTADLDAIKTTPHGRNFVEHDLPAADLKK